MPRLLVPILLMLLLLVAALVFFSTQADEVPTRTIETEVNLPADAR
jgi:hypothetical protein